MRTTAVSASMPSTALLAAVSATELSTSSQVAAASCPARSSLDSAMSYIVSARSACASRSALATGPAVRSTCQGRAPYPASARASLLLVDFRDAVAHFSKHRSPCR
jgi:hypothetical protein